MDDSSLPGALFLVHQWYLPSAELANHFLDLYISASDYCAICRRSSFAKTRTKPLLSTSSTERTSDDSDTVVDMDTSAAVTMETIQATPVGDCCCYKLKTEVCYALRHWVQLFPMHFDGNSALCRVLGEIRERVMDDGYSDLAKNLDVSTV